MKFFRRVGSGIDVAPLLAEIQAQESAWLANTSRQEKIQVQRDTNTIFLRDARLEAAPYPRVAPSDRLRFGIIGIGMEGSGVLTNAIDTEGNLPDELTAHLTATIRIQGYEPISFSDTFSGPRYTGQMGPAALFSPLASIVNILAKNGMSPVRVESVDCDVEIEPGRRVAAI